MAYREAGEFVELCRCGERSVRCCPKCGVPVCDSVHCYAEYYSVCVPCFPDDAPSPFAYKSISGAWEFLGLLGVVSLVLCVLFDVC